MFSASCDLAGPFIFDPVASGRDKGHNYRYILACAFTVPLSAAKPAPEVAEDKGPDEAILEAGDRSPRMQPADDFDLEGLFTAIDKAVRVRVRGKRPEPASPEPRDDTSVVDEPPEPPPLPPPADPPAVRTGLCVLALRCGPSGVKKCLGRFRRF